MYKSISINDTNFCEKLIKTFKEDGVCVINDVLTNDECEQYMNSIAQDFIKLDSGINNNNIIEWNAFNLPPQTRSGLFQALVSNLDAVWKIRSHNNIRKIFEILYSDLRKKQVKDFIVSGDGINIKPNNSHIMKTGDKDWAHIDQTDRSDIFKCIQGQCVLTNTTASFVASPKSHLLYLDILNKFNVNPNDQSNWLKFDDQQIEIVKKMMNDNKWEYQIPILAKRGSFIIWTSSLIHSARIQTKIEKKNPDDKFLGWRGVIYVCYRPINELSVQEIKKRQKAFEENRTTNHWGTKIFSKKPGSRWLYTEKKHPKIEEYIKDPKLVYQKLGKPILNNDQLKLLGY